MPTVIDSLLVTLGLKADDFHKEKKKVQTGLDDLAKSATKFLAVLGGTYEIKKFVQNQIEANAALQRFSDNLRESIETVSDWSEVTEAAGGSGKELQGTLQMLSRAQTELRLTGQSGLIPYLSALGVSLATVNGQARPVTDILLDLSDRFGRMDRQTAFNLGQMMGIDAGTLNAMIKGRPALEAWLSTLKKYAVTKEQGNEALRLNTALITLKLSFESFGRSLLQDVSPYLEKVIQAFQDFGDWCIANKSLVETFLGIMAAGIAAISIAALPITAAASAFVALGAAITLAWQDYQVWKNGGNSLFNWAPAIEITYNAFGRLKNILLDVLYRAANVGAALMALTDGNFSIAADAMRNAVNGRPGQDTTPFKPNDDIAGRNQFISLAAAKLGVPAQAIDAQLRLETGALGTKTIGAYNFGNIKAGKGWQGGVRNKVVKEFDPTGRAYNTTASFRSYSSAEDAANDYAAFIAQKYPNAVGAQSSTAFASALKAGGYATDPNYVNKISGIAGASNAAAGAAGGMSYPVTNNNRSSSVTVGTLQISLPNVSDAQSFAQQMPSALDYLKTSQANPGLQ